MTSIIPDSIIACSTVTCPCGSGQPYSRCCQPCHEGHRAKTAEQLMRSRYSAFSLGLIDYLIDTLHPNRRSPDDREQLRSSLKQTRWLALEIVDTQHGLASDQEGLVEFKATYLENDQLGLLHERSEFLQTERWYYDTGVILPTRLTIGRNDSCPCGSGLKYKKCHD